MRISRVNTFYENIKGQNIWTIATFQTQVIFAINQTMDVLTVSRGVVALDITVEMLKDIREEALVEMVKAKVVEVQLSLSDSFLP